MARALQWRVAMRCRCSLAVITFVAVAFAAARPAAATEAELTAGARIESRSDGTLSYRRQILAADVGAAALALGSMGVLSVPASALYVGTPTVIHLLHHSPGRAAISAGMRLALPLAGGLLASRLACDGGDGCKGTTILGGLAGALTASIVDIAFLAEERPRSSIAAVAPPGPEGPGVKTAGVTALGDGMGFIIGGTF